MQGSFVRLILALVVLGSLGVAAIQPAGAVPGGALGLPCGTSSQLTPLHVPPIAESIPLEINDGAVKAAVVGAELPGRPSAIAIGPDGSVYVAVTYNTEYPIKFASAIYGSIFQLVDGEAQMVVDGLPHPNGLLFVENDLYVSVLGGIMRIEDVVSAGCRSVTTVVDNLPFDDVHQTNGLAYGNGRIFVSQGSVYEPRPTSRIDLNGTVFSVLPDGSDLRVEATGFRNMHDIVFDSKGRLWGADNGPNAEYDLGIDTEDQVYPDEINLIEVGKDYGFHPQDAEGPNATSCLKTSCGTPPVASLDLHSGSSGVAWDERRGVVLIALSTFGQVVAYDPETGELNPLAWGMYVPTGVAVGADGALYVAAWGANHVLRIDLPADGGVA